MCPCNDKMLLKIQMLCIRSGTGLVKCIITILRYDLIVLLNDGVKRINNKQDIVPTAAQLCLNS